MDAEVLVVGAGPVGSTLALDLARRGVAVRIIDRAGSAFPGSRAKGVQPRTQEVLEDLGVLTPLLARASAYPKLKIHIGPLGMSRTMFKTLPATTDTPHPNIVLSPQFNTDRVLHDALRARGIVVEYGVGLAEFTQDDSQVLAKLSTGETVAVRYIVGADGGASVVRKSAGIPFVGSTDEEDRMIIADVQIPGLSRDNWHIWPSLGGRFLGACPLPATDLFQVMLRLPRTAQVSNNTASLRTLVRGALRKKGFRTGAFEWESLFRPNVRLAETYRRGRVFLAGDAAHSHTPAGGQGLNTGLQDSYNLGWKLAQVLAGAPETLLDTYEAERLPVAAGVLKLSNERYAAMSGVGKGATTRGDEERQLLLNYRGGPLATEPAPLGDLHVGDRLPDALDVDGRPVFRGLAGPDFGLLLIGDVQLPERLIALDMGPVGLRVLRVPAGTYGIADQAVVLVRPDNYVGGLYRANQFSALQATLDSFRPHN